MLVFSDTGSAVSCFVWPTCCVNFVVAVSLHKSWLGRSWHLMVWMVVLTLGVKLIWLTLTFDYLGGSTLKQNEQKKEEQALSFAVQSGWVHRKYLILLAIPFCTCKRIPDFPPYGISVTTTLVCCPYMRHPTSCLTIESVASNLSPMFKVVSC